MSSRWGGLTEPIHAEAAGPGDPVWKDNFYLALWDAGSGTIASVHASTSPNAPGGRRARCSVVVGGRTVEIVEPLDAGTFDSDSITIDLEGSVTVDHPDVQLVVALTPHLVPVDFSSGGVIPELVNGQPLQHFQHALTATGTVSVGGGEPVAFSAQGMRDRTWGFRDEKAQWIEYVAFVAVFDHEYIAVTKFLAPDGSTKTDGFIVGQDSVGVQNLRLSRDAAARVTAATLELADGTERRLDVVGRDGGFFVPMGSDTDGPAFGTYDDFVRLDNDGVAGGGMCEQGILHRIH